jgi:YtkA-like
MMRCNETDASFTRRTMTMNQAARVALRCGIPAFVLVLAACHTTTSGGADTTNGSGGDGTGGSEASICDTDPRAMIYSSGLTQTSMDGTVKATFSSANPAPPAKGENDWTVTLMDAHGSPMSGAALTVKPWMPDHGHGSSVVPTITPGSAAGSYQLENLDLFMPGIWQVTLTITPTGGTVETVVFSFCING